jgi:hypothetical protein
MMSLGHPPASEHWRIGLRDPRDRVPYFARMWLDGDAISTSANYEQFVAKDGLRYGHILDPRTGVPASGLLAVTVVAADATTTDSWDTPLYVLGLAAAKAKALARRDVAAVLVQPGEGRDTGVGGIIAQAEVRVGAERRALVRRPLLLRRARWGPARVHRATQAMRGARDLLTRRASRARPSARVRAPAPRCAFAPARGPALAPWGGPFARARGLRHCLGTHSIPGWERRVRVRGEPTEARHP